MRIATWVYPWDVADEGADQVLGSLREHGFSGLDLAATYHAISTLQPHNPRRAVFYTELGGVFFPARRRRYGRLLPRVWAEPAVIEAWPAVASRLSAYGLTLNAWTIGLFQPWLARAYPSCARVLPTGDRIPAGVCPANPAVQDYLGHLCADLAEQFPLRTIELEGIGFPDFAYGWARERIGIGLSDWARFLLSLCFCDACRQHALAVGLDIEPLRQRVVAALRARWATADDQPPVEPVEELAGEWRARDPDFAGFLALRRAAVAALVRSIAAAVAATPTRVAVYAPPDDGLRDGLVLADVLDVLGGVFLPPLATTAVGDIVVPAAVTRVAAEAAARPRPVPLLYSQSATWPTEPASDTFRATLTAALGLGVESLVFYHYGLLKRPQLATIQRQVAAARAEAGR